MRKIASTTELQSELQRILQAAQESNPSRHVLAADLRHLADRLVVGGKMPANAWTERGGQWMSVARYAGGVEHKWGIKEVGGKFTLSVKTDESSVAYKRKKDFDSLEAAQAYAWKFIDAANGAEKLESALDKDFVAQKA